MEKIDWEKAHKIFNSDKEAILAKLDREVKRYPYLKEILPILAAGTVISAVLLMPGLAKALSPVIWQGNEYKRDRLRQTLKRLKKQKLVDVVETKDGPVVRITENGITKALKYKLEEMKIKRPDSWDKKWRIIVFDIPESKKKIRDEFRKRLRQLGFFPLQKSVFAHAFPCSEEVEFLRQIYGVDIEVNYILATKIEEQEELRAFFNVG